MAAGEVGRGELLHAAPPLHHHQPLAHVGHHGEVVADHDEGEPVAAAHLLEEVQHLRLHRGVEGGGGFVEQQDLRLEDQGPRDGDALALAAGQLVRIAEPEAGAEPHLVERPLDAGLGVADAMDASGSARIRSTV